MLMTANIARCAEEAHLRLDALGGPARSARPTGVRSHRDLLVRAPCSRGRRPPAGHAVASCAAAGALRHGRVAFAACHVLELSESCAPAAGSRDRSSKRSARTRSRRIADGRARRRRRRRLRRHRAPAARERAARRARRHLPRRARPGEDPHDPLARRPARRVDADRRGQRDQRRPVRARLAPRPCARRRARRRDADRVGAPRASLRREARDARHVDRRPHRRGRPDQGRRGPLPLRRAHDPLRARARARTAASSRSTSSPTSPSASRSVCSTCSRSATCRSAATRSGCPLDLMLRRVGEPRGLHEPRPHHHAAEGPVRRADPHALPARRRRRDGRHRAGGALVRRPTGCG